MAKCEITQPYPDTESGALQAQTPTSKEQPVAGLKARYMRLIRRCALTDEQAKTLAAIKFPCC